MENESSERSNIPAGNESPPVQVGVPADFPLPHPLGANFFHFTIMGGEIQLLVGSVNLLQLREAAKEGKGALVVPDITHRFTLSTLGFEQLRTQIEAVSPRVKRVAGIVATAE